jgi:hypothetical protein
MQSAHGRHVGSRAEAGAADRVAEAPLMESAEATLIPILE